MPKSDPTTRTMKISDVKSGLSSLVNEVYRKETRVLVEKAGIPVAALISADDLRRFNQLERGWNERTKALERFSEAFADVPVEELESRVDAIIAANREADRAEAKRRSA